MGIDTRQTFNLGPVSLTINTVLMLFISLILVVLVRGSDKKVIPIIQSYPSTEKKSNMLSHGK